jgi:hypothetical protein
MVVTRTFGYVHLASLVLGDLVLGVLLALLALAVGPAGFRNVDLVEESISAPAVRMTFDKAAVRFLDSRHRRNVVRHLVVKAVIDVKAEEMRLNASRGCCDLEWYRKEKSLGSSTRPHEIHSCAEDSCLGPGNTVASFPGQFTPFIFHLLT